jgi:hypothetical protein
MMSADASNANGVAPPGIGLPFIDGADHMCRTAKPIPPVRA